MPAVWQDKSVPINYVVSSGRGTVFSFVVHHAPKVPGRTVPFVIALVELEEGVRMLGELRGRSCSCCDRYAGTSDLYRFPRLEPLRMGA